MDTRGTLRAAGAVLLLSVPGALRAQASAYVPLDDPRLPLLEHLIARGAIDDPSPFVRPFRRADAVRVLSAADTTGETPTGRLIHRLAGEFTDRTDETRYRIEGQGGFQAFSHARRDPLHPAGPGSAWPYADLGLEAAFGPVLLESRPALETRLLDDPDWLGRKDLKLTGRFVEGYLSAQWKWARLFYGEMDREWGPPGVWGIPLSSYGYPRSEFGLEVGTDKLRLSAQASQLRDERDSSGQVIHRYFFAHRLDFRPSRRLALAIWETSILAGADQNFDGRYRNPVTLLLLANEYGLGDNGNVLVGADLRWRAFRRVTFEGQLAIDDIQYQNTSGPNRYPNRYAFTLGAFGPIGGRASWHGFYTQASSLAFRTMNPSQNFIDGTVGLGRNYSANDQLTLLGSVPVRSAWLVSPEVTLLRQGEGSLTDAAPPRGPIAAALPSVLPGVVERTWRAAVGVSGRQGIVRLAANAGFHHIVNEGHQAGRTANRFEGRLTATLGFHLEGAIR